MSKAILSILCLLLVAAVSSATLNIPSAAGPLTINGVADEDLWKQAVALPLQPVGFGAPFPAGGEMRAVVRGGYLCLSSRLPETGRVVARSTGRNPVWWREDLVTWSIRYHSSDGRNTSLTVSVNPLGGYRVEPVGAGSEQAVLAAASIDAGGWGAEVAIQVSRLAAIGFISVERIRAPRPDAPELRWCWPGLNDSLAFQLASGGPSLMPPMVVTKDWGFSEPQTAPATVSVSLPTELASIPHRVWTDTERKSLAVEEMWEKNLKARVAEVAAAERRDWEKVQSLAEWEKFRDRRIAALKDSFGPFPQRTLLRTAVTQRLDLVVCGKQINDYPARRGHA